MSCCGGNCGCGSGCKCGNGCSGCKMFPDFSEASSERVTVAGFVGATGGSAFYQGEGAEMGAENDKCKCGPNCSCNPCNCK